MNIAMHQWERLSRVFFFVKSVQCSPTADRQCLNPDSAQILLYPIAMVSVKIVAEALFIMKSEAAFSQWLQSHTHSTAAPSKNNNNNSYFLLLFFF